MKNDPSNNPIFLMQAEAAGSILARNRLNQMFGTNRNKLLAAVTLFHMKNQNRNKKK
jgi:hypothetical protein